MNPGFGIGKYFPPDSALAKIVAPVILRNSMDCLRDESVHTSKMLVLWPSIARHFVFVPVTKIYTPGVHKIYEYFLAVTICSQDLIGLFFGHPGVIPSVPNVSTPVCP